MKLLNIALVSLLALSTTSVALAEGGSERSRQAIKEFRLKQQEIHGKHLEKQRQDKQANAAEGNAVKEARAQQLDSTKSL